MRGIRIVLAAGLFVAGVVSAPVEASGRSTGGQSDASGLEIYTAPADAAALAALRGEGVDVHELAPAATTPGASPTVDVVLSTAQADRLSAVGVDVERKATTAAAEGDGVFRPYSGDGGIAEELEQLAADHPGLTELVTLGKSVQGKDILALRVTQRARTTRDGARPASLFFAGQHAREWISPEMVRRLAHHLVDGYGDDPAITELLRTTEVWLVPVANPDGYDFSFTPGNRLWRKNMRDNDRDGRITAADGVDLNRNMPTRWFQDDEGSASAPAAENYRGSAPASEPESRALDRLMDRIGFEYLLNYHSASESLFYGTAWQVATPTPDDQVFEALVGDARTPAVPGSTPGVLANLYIANGETTEHAAVAHGTLGVLVELSTCQTASAVDADDRWLPTDCASGFLFPDDEALIDGEFRKNLPLALATARSVTDPDHPVSVTGRTTPELVVDDFAVAYGDPQPVAVTARRDQHVRRLNYRIAGGRTHSVPVQEWDGGERYGDDHDTFYAEYRGEVRGADPGDRVEVWFTARTGRTGERGSRAVASEHFTYTVAPDAAADPDVLIIASEDYKGVSPRYPAGTAAPKYADEYAAALDANGVSHATWDVDAQGVPHPLGVLSHFDTVIWETGDDRLPQDPEDQLTDTFLFGPLPDIAVAERQQYLTIAVRDYLNEGGRLIQAGETVQLSGLLGRSLGGIYYGLAGAPDQDCRVTGDFLADCLLLSDDFSQYYLGASNRTPFALPTGFTGQTSGRARGPLDGVTATFGGQATVDNPLNEAGAFSLTSEVLPEEDFPQFAGELLGAYVGARNPDPFAPVEGSRYAGALLATNSYQRIGRTIDLRDVDAAAAPRLTMKLSYSMLQSFHHLVLEAAPAGTDRWTTLRDLNGRTSPAPPAPCADGVLLRSHPFLLRYLTPGVPGAPACGRTGTTGAWNAFTGESNGWVDAAFDLSAYAGQQVDVKVAYVTDGSDAGTGGGIGVFVDDTRVTAGGQVLDADGFESGGPGGPGGPGRWRVEGPPAGSPPRNQGDFVLGPALIHLAPGVATDDTVILGFGLEAIASPSERATLLGRLLDQLDQPGRRQHR